MQPGCSELVDVHFIKQVHYLDYLQGYRERDIWNYMAKCLNTYTI